MSRRNGNTHRITLEYIDTKLDAKFDRFEEKWARDRKEEAARHAEIMEKMEARLAADHEKSELRLAADRKEAAERFERERKEARMEFRSHNRWLKATFAAVIIGMLGIFAALNGYVPFVQGLGGG